MTISTYVIYIQNISEFFCDTTYIGRELTNITVRNYTEKKPKQKQTEVLISYYYRTISIYKIIYNKTIFQFSI